MMLWLFASFYHPSLCHHLIHLLMPMLSPPFDLKLHVCRPMLGQTIHNLSSTIPLIAVVMPSATPRLNIYGLFHLLRDNFDAPIFPGIDCSFALRYHVSLLQHSGVNVTSSYTHGLSLYRSKWPIMSELWSDTPNLLHQQKPWEFLDAYQSLN